jgi:hypothetical protein
MFFDIFPGANTAQIPLAILLENGKFFRTEMMGNIMSKKLFVGSLAFDLKVSEVRPREERRGGGPAALPAE